MAKVIYALTALGDLERLLDFLEVREPRLLEVVAHRISEAVTVLGEHPLIGRPVEHGLRELVISRARTGYVALYRYQPERNLVVVLAIRHQREAGPFDPHA